jgi:hypothetical protein
MAANYTIKVPEWLDRICTWPVMWYRSRKYGYSYRRIYLGEGEWTIVDPKEYYLLGNFKWYLSGNGKKFYAIRNIKTGPRQTKIVTLHREIMKAAKGILVDHKDGNSLDNRRANLRVATHSQNMCNKRVNKNGCTSKFRGVCWNKRERKWETKLSYQRKKLFHGRYDTEVEAAKAYDEAAKKYHGEFARLNFPEESSNILR